MLGKRTPTNSVKTPEAVLCSWYRRRLFAPSGGDDWMFTVAALLDTYLIEISIGTALHCSLREASLLPERRDRPPVQSTDSCSTAVVSRHTGNLYLQHAR